MTEVATSELRANLKDWISRARDGEDVVITERGHPVARLSGVDSESVIERLTREGVIGRPQTTEGIRASDIRRVRTKDGSSLSDYVTKVRGDDEWP